MYIDDIKSFYKENASLKNTIIKFKNRHITTIDICNIINDDIVEMTDEIVMDFILDKSGRISSTLLNKISKSDDVLTNFEKRLRTYLINRFDDSDSLKETILRIEYKKYTRPLCPECKKNKVNFTANKYVFTKFCSRKCSRNNEESKENYRNSLIRLYGDPHYNNMDKNKETCKKKYGVSNVFATDWCKSKIEKHWMDSYGVKNANQVPEITKKHNFAELNRKGCETKKKNHTFNTSKPEEECYSMLIDKFGTDDIERQYNDSIRYPFNCDFYIKSKDLFIEYNGIWTHGKHPYDPKSNEDNDILNKWKERSKEKKFYKIAIDVWTRQDPNKRIKAKESKINIIEIWSLKEFKEFIEKA